MTSQNPDTHNLLSTPEAARVSGYTVGYISKLIRFGKIAGVRKNGVWFVHRNEISKYLSASVGRDMLTTFEAGRLSGYTTGYVSKLIRDQKLEGIRKNGTWFVKRSDFDAYLATVRKERLLAREQLSQQLKDERKKTAPPPPSPKPSVPSSYTPMLPLVTLGVLGFAALVVAAGALLPAEKPSSEVAAALTPLRGPQRFARATFGTAHALLSSAEGELAYLLSPAPTINNITYVATTTVRSAPVAPATPRILNTFPTYTSVVEGVSQNMLNQSLADLRTNILQQVSGLIAPLTKQTATNETTIQYVNLAQESGNETLSGSTNSGTVTSVDVSGGTTGLSFSGGPITTGGTLTLAGTLAITSGGTGTTTLPSYGQVLVGDANGTYELTATSSLGIAGGGGGSGVSSLSQTYGSAETGALTLATSSDAVTGLIDSLAITNSSGAFTLAPSLSGTLNVPNGGTGTSTAPTYGQLLLGDASGNYELVATSSLGITSNYTASYPIELSGSNFSLAFGTTTANSWSELQQFSGGASTTALTITGTASTSALVISGLGNGSTQCLQINGEGVVSSTGVACGAVNSVSNNDGTLTVSPTTGAVVASLNLGNANSWTALQQFTNASSTELSVYGPSYFGGSATSSFSSTGALTLASLSSSLLYAGSSGQVSAASVSSPFYFTSGSLSLGTVGIAKGGIGTTTAPLLGQLLIGDASGNYEFVATSSLGLQPAGSYLTSAIQNLGPAGQLQSGATVTIASSTSSFNGLTVGNTITGSGNTLTFSPTLSGTLSASGGGTGISSPSAAGMLLGSYAGGSYQQIATSSLGLAVSSFASPDISQWTNDAGYLTSSGIGSGIQGQFPFYNAAGTALTATSSIFLAQNGNVGIGTTSPYAQLSIFAGSNYGSLAASTLFAIGSTTAGTATSTLLDVLSSGNIGIGTTTPHDTLSFGATPVASVNDALINLTNNNIGVGSSNGAYIAANPATAGANFLTYTVNGANSDSFQVSSRGDLSITDTVSGVDPIDVSTVGSSNVAAVNITDNMNGGSSYGYGLNLTVTDSTTGTGAFRGIYENTGALSAATGEKSLLRLDTHSSPTFQVLAEGEVGVGTSSPLGLLTLSDNTANANVNAFLISSSTASATTTLFAISNTGSTTAANGFNITAGCYAINGTCLPSTSVSSLSQTYGSAQTGALTFATSSSAITGLTIAENITNSGGTFTFAPTLAGMLSVANGGTGTTTGGVTNGVEYYNGSSLTNSNGLTWDGTQLTINTNINGGLNLNSNNTTGTSFNIDNTSSGGHSFAFYSTGSANTPGHFGIYDNTSNKVLYDLDGTSGNMQLISGALLGWSSNGSYAEDSADTGLSRLAAGEVAIGNGTAGNTSGTLAAADLIASTATIGSLDAPIVVSGTLSPNVTGTYPYAGQYDSQNYYYDASKSEYIWYRLSPIQWVVSPGLGDVIDPLWYVAIVSATPPQSGWSTYNGSTGTLSTATGEGDDVAVDSSGDLTVGGVLTVNGAGNSSFLDNVGIGTTSPYAQLSIFATPATFSTNNVLFALGSSTASYATSTLFSISNTGSTTAANGFNITAGCYAVNGSCLNTNGGVTSLSQTYGSAQMGVLTLATSSALSFNGLTLGQTITNSGGTFTFTPTLSGLLSISGGGTGTSTAPTYGQLLMGDANGNYELVATSSLGISGGSGGTVGSGTTGEFPYYAASGSTLTATSSIFLATSGDLGIGTTTPFGALTINTPANELDALAVTNSIGSTTLEADTIDNASSILSVGTSTGATYFMVGSGGNIGVGTTTPWQTFSVNGTLALSNLASGTSGNALCINASNEVTEGVTCTVSSERYKNSIEDLDDSSGLNEVMALQPVSFKYDEGYGDNGAATWVGFIAEQAETVDPRLVPLDASGDPSGFYYQNYTAILTKGLQQVVGALDVTNALTGSSTLQSFYQGIGAPAITVDATGDVGIGTSTPNALLSVNGTVYANDYTAPVSGFGTSTSTLFAQLPPQVLTANGSVDLLTLATYTLQNEESLAASVNSLSSALATLQGQLNGLESNVILEATSSTSTPAISSWSSDLQTALASTLQSLSVGISQLQNAGTSLAASLGVFDNVFAGSVHTDLLCVGDVCVTKAQFLTMVQNSGVQPEMQPSSGAGAQNTTAPPENSSTATSTDSSDATSTDAINATSTPPAALPPVITLNGPATVDLDVGDSWSDTGATASDPTDGDLTSQIVETGTVDTTTAGTYTLTYSVTDSQGLSTSAMRTVVVEDDSGDASSTPS